MPTLTEWEAARRGCVECCERCLALLDAVPDDAYSGDDSSGQAIGPHLRHAIDHFMAFLRGIDTGKIEYDVRDRDERIERSREAARAAVDEIRRGLVSLAPATANREIEIIQTPAKDTDPMRYVSTGDRELVFLSSHTIHHLALIACLCDQRGISLPESFSLAFSTAAYRQVATG